MIFKEVYKLNQNLMKKLRFLYVIINSFTVNVFN